MKAITLWQPYAQLVAVGAKKNETRSWPTSYRGPLAIHAAKTMQGWYVNVDTHDRHLRILKRFGVTCAIHSVPYGKIIAVCNLVNCYAMDALDFDVSELEKDLGDYSPGRFAWILGDVWKLKYPVDCRGRQGLWNVSSIDCRSITCQRRVV